MIKIRSNNVSQNAPAQTQPTEAAATGRASTSHDKFTGVSRTKALLGTAVLALQAASVHARGLNTPWSQQQDQNTVSPFTSEVRQSAGGNQGQHGNQAWEQGRSLSARDGAYRPAFAPTVSAPGPFVPSATAPTVGPVDAEPDHWLAPNSAPSGAGAPDGQG